MSEKQLKFIRTAVEESGFRTKYLAEKIGVSRATLRGFVTGRQNLGRPALLLLAQTLNINLEDILNNKAS